MNNIAMRVPILALTVLVAAAGGFTQGVSILWLGNSFTGLTGLYNTTKSLINAGKTGVAVDKSEGVFLWGQGLDAHWNNAASLQKVRSGAFRYVVLQGYINMGALEYADMAAKTADYGARLAEEARQAGSTPLIYSHHANCNSAPQQWKYVADAYIEVSRLAKATLVPCTEAWLHAKAKRPGLNLHDPDCHHQGIAGDYLNACVFYAVITGKSPVGNSYVGSGLDASTAAFLQQMAWETVDSVRGGTPAHWAPSVAQTRHAAAPKTVVATRGCLLNGALWGSAPSGLFLLTRREKPARLFRITASHCPE